MAVAVKEPFSTESPAGNGRNRYDRMEWAGAFGDLGTLIPFVVAYIGVLGMAPFGILFAFGASMLVCGLYYKTPFPVQPMKAIGAVAALQAVQTSIVTPGAVYSAALVTGAVWLVLGLTGLVSRLARLVPATVVIGILLGLGVGFMLEGIRLMAGDWLIAALGASGAVLLMGNRRIPAMFALLAFGALVGGWRQPDIITQLAHTPASLSLPSFAMSDLRWNEFLVGALLLALPQLPLTLGNAIIGITAENNRLFPQHQVSERRVALSTGIMNVFSAAAGGVPMCHGAGGMAGHIAFGARTGGSMVILGALLLLLALFFSDSVTLLFQLLPAAILGVILFLTSLQLAVGSSALPADRQARIVILACAALCIWNVGLGFVVGILLHWLAQHQFLRL